MVLGPRQEQILKLLADANEPLTAAEIAKRIKQDKTNAAKCLKTLEDEGFVERSKDGRSKPYALSDAGRQQAARLHSQDPSRAFTRMSTNPELLSGVPQMKAAVKVASRLTVAQVFQTELAKRLNVKTDAVLDECERLREEGERDIIVEAIGDVISDLKPERSDVEQWMRKHLAALIGPDGLTEIVRCSTPDRIGYEIVIHADCMGVVECLVAMATNRPADLKLTKSVGDEVSMELDSPNRIEMMTASLMGEREAEDVIETRAEQCFIEAYARQPEFARISKSEVPKRYLKKKVTKDRQANRYVVFDATSEDETAQRTTRRIAQRFQEVLMSKKISVTIVLQGPASKTMAEIQAWLREYFRWPLEEEAS